MQLRVLKFMGMTWQGERIIADNQTKTKLIMTRPQKKFREKVQIQPEKPVVLSGGLPE